MRPDRNMDITPAKGYTPTALGYDKRRCELCLENGKAAGGSRFLWLLGRPAMRVCLPCSREMKRIWKGAL